jgi:small subunit ribosomal protein S20
VRTLTKKVRAAVASGDGKQAQEALNTAVPAIGKVASKGVIPKRRASRLISRLTRAVNAIAK